MDPALLLTLVLGFTHTTLAFNAKIDCPGTCPSFTQVADDGTYEERRYSASEWMCTDVNGTGFIAAMAADGRLRRFRSQQRKSLNGNIREDTWPVIVSMKQVDGGEKKYEMCFLIFPDVTLPNHDSVTVRTIPNDMFVRYFTGFPTIPWGEENAEKLKEDLVAAGESFDDSTYYGVIYSRYFPLFATHHNEIWIPKV